MPIGVDNFSPETSDLPPVVDNFESLTNAPSSFVDDLTSSERKRLDLILKIQELYKDGGSARKIAENLHVARGTVRKYIIGDPETLCRSNVSGILEEYRNYIIQSIKEGLTQSSIARGLSSLGYQGTITNARRYVYDTAKRYGLELRKYKNGSSDSANLAIKRVKVDYVSRKGIFNHLWLGIELSEAHHKYLWEYKPILKELELCIRHFREVFFRKNMPMLYLFIERYMNSTVKEIASFANGLKKDIAAVENAVASPMSNGYVEGTNSKVKTKKKAMYGRCGIRLLRAKLMYRQII
jgi:predicted transcriptional regulator